MIDAYHALLTPEIAEASHEHLEAVLRKKGLVFGGRPLCTVLRPRLVTVDEYATLQQRVVPLLRAFAKIHDRAMQDAGFRAQFGLADWEETLLADDPGYSHPSPTSRLDFFLSPRSKSLGLTEYNAETPAGAGYGDALTDAFLDLPVVREFARTHDLFPVPSRPGVTGALLHAWREFSGTRARPRIAILDWLDVPTRTEFELFQAHFHALGLECVIDDPRHADYRGGKLFVQDAPVDLIYKRVLISELVEQCGLDSAVVRAVRERAVCMVNGFRCKLLHKKASLAVLSDEANAGLFDTTERLAIADCVPWTRVVAERITTWRGAEVDLLRLILDLREWLVLKPNDEYGGKGITLGWTVDDSTWEQAVHAALATPHIVQERVEVPSEPYPSWVDGRVEVIERQFDTAPFVTNGAYMEGLLTRLSTAVLLNVTAGGGSTVPTFLVAKRS
ncbi:MAG TPA: hypothetical protein VFZ73_16905 [Gemmatimonadaceae bacterium]